MPIRLFAKNKSFKKMAVAIFFSALFLASQIAYSAANGFFQQEIPVLLDIAFGSAIFLIVYLVYTTFQFFAVAMKEF